MSLKKQFVMAVPLHDQAPHEKAAFAKEDFYFDQTSTTSPAV